MAQLDGPVNCAEGEPTATPKLLIALDQKAVEHIDIS